MRLVGALAVASVALAAYGSTGGEGAGGAVGIGALLPYIGPFELYGKPMEMTLRARFAKARRRPDRARLVER
jgi:hypothetical protein